MKHRPGAGSAIAAMSAANPWRQRYRLIEQIAEEPATEEFLAPDDATAIARALAALEGRPFQLWRGARLVFRDPPSG